MAGAGIGIKGKDVLIKALRKMDKGMQKTLRDEIRDTAYGIERDYRSNMKSHMKTGELDQSIRTASIQNWKGAQVGSDKKQSTYLEFGTRAHGPVRAKLLHWVEDGKDIFAKWVRGITATNGLLRAYVNWMHGKKFDIRFTRRAQRMKL